MFLSHDYTWMLSHMLFPSNMILLAQLGKYHLWYLYIKMRIKAIITVDMEGQKSANTSKKKERVRLYKKKVHSIHEGRQYRVGRVKRLKHIVTKSNDKLLDLTSQITVFKKTVNTTAANNKLLQRYIKG